jgi:hypothetical protein
MRKDLGIAYTLELSLYLNLEIIVNNFYSELITLEGTKAIDKFKKSLKLSINTIKVNLFLVSSA